VRLTAAGKTLTAPLTIKIDPRVHATQAELKGMFEEDRRLAEMVSTSASAALEVHSAREQIETLSKSAQPPVKDAVEKLDKELGELLSGHPPNPGGPGGEEQPGIDDVTGETAGLYEQVGSADAAPTAAQLKAADRESEELTEVLDRWQHAKETSIAALNRQLDAAHLPLLDLKKEPQTMPDSGDED
jgi:hypothetical protein